MFLAYASASSGRTLVGPGVVPAPGLGPENWERRRGGRSAGQCRLSQPRPQLAQLMLQGGRWNREYPFAWFTGDEVYGSDRNLRLWLER